MTTTRELALSSAADLARLTPDERAAAIAHRRAIAGPRAGRLSWDAESRIIAAEDRAAFRRRLDESMSADRNRWLRMRWRWRLDEFADAVVRPITERSSRWFEHNPVNRAILAWPADHWRLRPADGRTAQYLVWAPRGAAKTTSMKIRGLHVGLYGLEAGVVVIASGATAAKGWTRTLSRWMEHLPPLAREVFGDARADGPEDMITIHTRGASTAYHARGWDSAQIRGLNEGAARPTLCLLDDIESRKTTSSPDVREKAQDKLLEQVLPLLPSEGGGIVQWAATPVHDDGLSTRAFRRRPGLARWACLRYQAVIRWPARMDLWDTARKMYLDVDSVVAELQAAGVDVDPVRVQERQIERLGDVYAANRAEMDEGAEVMDPGRLPILACFMRRWDMGDEAFQREYQTEASVRREGAIFDSSGWTRMALMGRTLYTPGGIAYPLASLNLQAHWDPSDGGDPGALAMGVKLPDGRGCITFAAEYPGRMSEQIRTVVRECDAWDVAVLQAEANMMHDSEQQELRKAVEVCNRARVAASKRPIGLVFQATTENKETRIRSLDTPWQTGRLAVATTVDDVLARRADAWDPGKTRNVDDVLDAVQRVAEKTIGAGKVTRWATGLAV